MATDRLGELLAQNKVLYGMICRDATLTDIELLAQAGYHVVWIDLEHGSLSAADAMRLCRSIVHLGLIPLVRIGELSRTQVQGLLDCGFAILVLPNVKQRSEAEQLVRLCKFPPLGQRGLSSNSAAIGFALGDDPQRKLREANATTHLMVQVESDEGLANLDDILQVQGIDWVTVGPLDWSVELGLFGEGAKGEIDRRVEAVLAAAARAGRSTAIGISSAEQARHYVSLGARLIIAGVDVTLKRTIFAERLASLREALG